MWCDVVLHVVSLYDEVDAVQRRHRDAQLPVLVRAAFQLRVDRRDFGRKHHQRLVLTLRPPARPLLQRRLRRGTRGHLVFSARCNRYMLRKTVRVCVN